MKHLNYQNIITKQLLGEASSEELMMLEQWRKESPQNDHLYQEYADIWNASANYTPVDFQPNAESAYLKHIELLANEGSKVIDLNSKLLNNKALKPKNSKIFTLQRIASIAALFIVVLGAMFVFNSINTTNISAENGIVFASLEDGSSIWLDKGSSLSYKSGFGEFHRNIELKGKAFFDVKRNPDLEFNISSNDMVVTVLGTSFTVDTKSGNNTVAVKSGKVAVTLNENKVTLLPNEKVRFVNNRFVEEIATDEDVNWRNRDLSFNNARLDQVVADINLFHKDKIVLLSESGSLDCPFTSGSLAATSFENIIEILKVTYDLQTEEDTENGTTILKISDCK